MSTTPESYEDLLSTVHLYYQDASRSRQQTYFDLGNLIEQIEVMRDVLAVEMR